MRPCWSKQGLALCHLGLLVSPIRLLWADQADNSQGSATKMIMTLKYQLDITDVITLIIKEVLPKLDKSRFSHHATGSW